MTPKHQSRPGVAPVRRWNEIAVNASGLDHTPVAPGGVRVFREQFGPPRASRAMAIVHIAMFDAANAIAGGYRSYTGIPRASEGTSLEAAVAQAAHDSLTALYPSQKSSFDGWLEEDLDQIRDGRAKKAGTDLGRRVAAAILARRANDGSQHAEPRLGTGFMTSDEPGKWRQDPIGQTSIALGALWGGVTPFVLDAGSQFRVPPPPALDSAAYAAAFNEVKQLGGDGIITPSTRTEDQTVAGIYWAYDGTPSLCAPPRLYNQIAVQIADQMGSNDVELGRLLALVNVAMADDAIAIWESKYFYQFWRPITGIREADSSFVPLGAPMSNLSTRLAFPGRPGLFLSTQHFTPPFPSYPSAHAGFGGALFETLRNFYHTDHIAFTFVSDEFNDVTAGNDGKVRPLLPRSFSSLSQAEEENGQSRIYLGIHWEFDKTEGINQGRRVADFVFTSAFVPTKNIPNLHERP